MSNGEVQLNMLVLVPALVERLEQVAPDLLAGQLPAGLSGGSLPPSQLQRSLASAVGHLLPPDLGYVTLMQSSSLAAAQRAVQVLDNLAWVLVVAALVSIALTLVLSVDRWRTALWLAVGVVLGMPLAGAGLLAVQGMLETAVAGRAISGAAQAAIMAVCGSIGQLLLVVWVVAVAIAVVAFVAGRRAGPTRVQQGAQAA